MIIHLLPNENYDRITYDFASVRISDKVFDHICQRAEDGCVRFLNY